MKTNKKQSIIALASVAIAIFLILIPYTALAAEVAPVANFITNVTDGSVPLTVSFTDQSTGNVTTWKWEFGDGTTSYSKSPVEHTYIKPKTYSVKLTVYDAYGRSKSTTQKITVKPQILVPSFSPDVTQGTVPLTISFTDQSTGNIIGWKWEFGDGTISYGNSPASHTYIKPKTYTVKLTVNDAYGSSKSTTQKITVKPQILVSSFSPDVIQGTVPLTVSFTDQSTGSITAWKWEFGDGTTSYVNSPATHTYIKPTTYTVKLTVYDAYGSSKSTTQKITVKPQILVPSFSPDVTQGTVPLTISFTDQSTGNIIGWKWEFGDGTISYGNSPAPHTYIKPKTYTVKLTVYDAYGSSKSTTKRITVV
jgi:PKD repeat protein